MTDTLTTNTTDFMPSRTSDAFARPFTTLMWVEGRWTGDGRLVLPDAITWDGLLPMPLTVDHDGIEEVVGRVDTIERQPGATADERFIVGKGMYDLGGPPEDLAHQVERLIEAKYARGVSMELDAMTEGGIDPDTAPEDMPPGSGGWVTVVETARVRALSVVTTAAFAEAHITFDDTIEPVEVPAIEGPEAIPSSELPEPEMPEDIIIVAAGHTITLPQVPPAEWFQEPDVIDGGLTVTDEGRVYGWLAPANVPYSGIQGNFSVPMGNVNYSRWQNRVTVVDDGTRVMTGNITMGCGHGDTTSTNHQAVRDHYDNSCSLFARVAAGENQHGVWIAGALYPGVTGEQVARAMGLQCSGHWIPSTAPGYSYDLEAALLVPVPGFNAARRAPSVTMRDGALAASAVPVQFADCGCGGATASAAPDRLADVERRLAALERPALVEQLRHRISGE
jgi:hypothetical protein